MVQIIIIGLVLWGVLGLALRGTPYVKTVKRF